MFRAKPRRLHCTSCGREYYNWHDHCYTCYRTNTIDIKDEYKSIEPRNEVKEFAEVMEKKLRANDHKGGWDNCSIDFLTYRLREEQAELFQVLRLYHMFPSDDTKKRVEDECADVANFALFIRDLVNKGVK